MTPPPEAQLTLARSSEPPFIRGPAEAYRHCFQPLAEIIERVNDLFDGDRLAYVNGLNKGKMLQSDLLRMQAANNTKEQFANSPDLNKALLDATTDALDAHTKMSKRARESETVREWLKSMLLGPAQLYEALSQ